MRLPITSKENSSHHLSSYNLIQQQQKLTHSQITKMQNKSKFNKIWHTNIVILIFVLICSIIETNGVPTENAGGHLIAARPFFLRRVSRNVATLPMAASLVQEELPKDGRNEAANPLLSSSTETMPVDQPQGQCLHEGSLVPGNSVTCEVQVGCRAIQKTGHCCPDYKCDCEKDGKTYSNGDKLVDPETPCTVCYCKGGEILCSSAVCFHRDDCRPRYIPGRCCPEYDNCPVSVSNNTIAPNQPSPAVVTSVAQATKPDTPPVIVLNPNITIKEITKPTEIRITDENKKPIHQMRKVQTSSTTTTTTTAATPPADIAPADTETINSIAVATTELKLVEAEEAKPIEPSISQNTSNNKATSTEDIDQVEPNSISQSNKKAESPISQELQHIGSNEDSGKINIKRENMLGTTEGIFAINSASPTPLSDLDDDGFIFPNPSIEPETIENLNNNVTDLDSEPSGSDNIYHIILSTDGPGLLGLSVAQETVPKTTQFVEGINPEAVSGFNGIGDQDKLELSMQMTDAENSTMDGPIDSSTEGIAAPENATFETAKTPEHHMEEEESPMPMESNPAYPSLPEDDFSLREVNFPLVQIDETGEIVMKDEHRLVKDEKHEEEIGSGFGNSLAMPENDTESMNGGNMTESNANQMSEQQIQLMQSMEDNVSSENTFTNSTDLSLDRMTSNTLDNDTFSGFGDDSLEMEPLEAIISSMDFGSGSGSGSGELFTGMPEKLMKKEREPTTPKPTKHPQQEPDLDELVSSSDSGNSTLGEDPKLDAESLKLDEKQDEGIVAPNDGRSAKSNVITIKLSPVQDKTFYRNDENYARPGFI